MDTRLNKLIHALLVVLIILSVITANGFAASTTDSIKKEVKKIPEASETIKKDTTKQIRGKDVVKNLPVLSITSFKKKIDVAPGTVVLSRNPGAPPPTSARINFGDEITLSWVIVFKNVTTVRTQISGIGTVSPGTLATASDGTTYYSGEVTIRPSANTTYRLTATARPTSGNVRGTPRTNKSFSVTLLKPEFEILQPSVNDDTLEVEFSVRNTGDGDFRPTPIIVNYEIFGFGGRSNFSVTRGTFTTPRTGINKGQRFTLGSIPLGSFRDQLFAYQAMSIRVRVGANYILPLQEASEMFRHNWEESTITLNQGILDLLAPVTTCEVRLNNYNSSNPRIPRANDAYVHLNMMDMGGEPARFSVPAQRYRVRVTGRVTGHDYVDELVLFLINEIQGSGLSTGLLSIRNGKLGIHLEFPNSGSSEIKLGTVNDRSFDDGEVPDINIGRFTVDAWLTPSIHNNRVSYSSIQVDVPSVSASLTGRFDGLNPIIRRYLSDYVTNEIRNQLNSILGRSDIKTAIENGLADALGFGSRTINQIVSVRGSGNSITITYR